MKSAIAPIVAALLLATAASAQEPAGATGTFLNADGAEVGTIELREMDGGVHVTGTVTGIPAGEHGAHFHAVGNCDPSVGFETAEGHFNPESNEHGLENPAGAHAGDLPNVTADDAETVTLDLHTTTVSLTADNPAYIFDADGTAFVIHADPDDQMTDPSGNSGDRIACAVLEAP